LRHFSSIFVVVQLRHGYIRIGNFHEVVEWQDRPASQSFRWTEKEFHLRFDKYKAEVEANLKLAIIHSSRSFLEQVGFWLKEVS